jgi:murein DD-endopeptidase MepM/ murein hydrolase activator NlpD
MAGGALASVPHLMRLGAVRAVCRVLTAVVAVAAAYAAVTPATAAPVQSDDEVAAARQRVIDAQNAANEAAARFTEAQSRYEQLGDQIAEVEARIKTGEARAAHLREIVQRRAVVAYKTQGTELAVIFGSDNRRDGLRSSELLAAANSADYAAAAEYAALAEDLAAQRERLANERKLQKQALDHMEAERAQLDEMLADAQEAEANLATKAQAAVEAAPENFPATTVNAPVIDGLVCPVPGAAFSNDYGQPRSGGRSHQGNDMFASIGTANLAVVSGHVSFGNGGAGGMGAYLAGDNGVTYIYYHLSEYVGGERQVAQGEVIGKVGQTGNASAPHTHFEIRPGGRTASPTNPYATLTKIC